MWVTIPGRLGKLEDGLPFGSGRANGLRNPEGGYPWVSSGSSSNSMDVSPYKSTCWPVLTAMTSGAAGRVQREFRHCRTGKLPSPIGHANATPGSIPNSGRGPNPSHLEMDGSRSVSVFFVIYIYIYMNIIIDDPPPPYAS